ncbi:hypothetical protein IWZ01DRAFT_544696 [Phyllosticta capitalensis]
MPESFNITLSERQAEIYNDLRSLLVDLEKLLKCPTRFLNNLIQNGSNMIQAKQHMYGTTSPEQPLYNVIHELLSRGKKQGVHDHLVRTAVDGLIQAVREIFGLLRKMHFDLTGTIESMPTLPPNYAGFHMVDDPLFDSDEKFHHSYARAVKCLQRLHAEVPLIDRHVEKDLQAFIYDSISTAAVDPGEWENTPFADRQASYKREWSAITEEWKGGWGDFWDQPGREEATDRYIAFIQLQHVKDLLQVVADKSNLITTTRALDVAKANQDLRKNTRVDEIHEIRKEVERDLCLAEVIKMLQAERQGATVEYDLELGETIKMLQAERQGAKPYAE